MPVAVVVRVPLRIRFVTAPDRDEFAAMLCEAFAAGEADVSGWCRHGKKISRLANNLPSFPFANNLARDKMPHDSYTTGD